MTIGKISGPMLRSNLERQGQDLAFDTNLAYLNVGERIVAINTANVYSRFDPNLTYCAEPHLVVNGAILADSLIGNLCADPATGSNTIVLNSNTVVVTGTSSFVMPRGNTAQRPANAEVGSARFNTDTNNMEVWTGTIWQVTTREVTGESFQGDGNTVAFTPNASILSDGDINQDAVLVTVNGVIQEPGITKSYTVANNVITFSEPPSPTDSIYVRYISNETAPPVLNYVSIDDIKNFAANSATFDEFKAFIANL